MWIRIPSNETAWEMPKTGKKRSRKQGKGNYWDVHVQISIPLQAAKAPRNLRFIEKCAFLDGQSSFWQDTIWHEPSSDLAETFSNKVTRNWFQEIFCRQSPATVVWPANFCHDSCESGSAGSSLPLPSIFARLALTVSFSHRFCSCLV